jgi:phage I-like protein
MAEQVTRGNRLSIDVDHMSLDKSAPLENHQAVGWFTLAVRDGELWATDIEWVNDAIRAGLVKGAWKYMSPAYDVDDAGEVVSFLNLSLTANPATHSTTALASRGARKKTNMTTAKKMSWGDIKAALDGDDENAKASAYAAIQAAFPDKEPDGDEGEEKKEDADDDAEKKAAKKCAEDEPEKKDAKTSDDDAEKKDTANVVAAQDARIRKLEADNAAFRKERDEKERTELIAGREMSSELARTLATKPLAFVRDICSALPKKVVIASRSTETSQATRGGNADTASRLPPEESQKLAERMGLRAATAKIGWDPNMRTTRVFPALAGVPAKKEG